MSIIISTLNQKGGVGKTTNTMNIAVEMANRGARVLVIDMDVNQASLTKCILGDLEEGTTGILHVLATNVEVDRCIHPTKVENLYIIPSEEKINGMEINIEHVLFSKPNPQNVLTKRLRGSIVDDFDLVIIDNGPNLNQVTINSLVVSDYFLVSFTPADMTIDGIKKLFSLAQSIQEELNPNLNLLGVIFCMVDKREKISKEARQILNEMIGDHVFKTEIRVNASFKTLRRSQHSIFDVVKIGGKKHKRNADSSNEYKKLTNEIFERIEMYENAQNQDEITMEGGL